jgi:hypothetical protein
VRLWAIKSPYGQGIPLMNLVKRKEAKAYIQTKELLTVPCEDISFVLVLFYFFSKKGVCLALGSEPPERIFGYFGGCVLGTATRDTASTNGSPQYLL